ncbi:nuclear transport factor 2 family protein [Leptolyngbya sp. NK1-12]|uniref:Nuclear transport factor 2 family protein n=1 Tax=Leptolyngbya sp. NK1-12 TaxID=2547451 RepID=A0AA97AKF4_9CYAN|nr:nuclear transport factor 2 family protein [Leptolyngbya sp. NK1-12]WNZ23567.1 nuclear transport factor 2 family protein [Leptolyngbya sp. NK1-12]
MTTAQDVLATNQAFYQAFERLDIDALSLVWSKAPKVTCIHPGRSALRGWEQIRFSWDQIFRNTKQLEVAADVIATEVIGNVAYVVLVENLVQVVPERRMEVQTMVTNIFEYEDGNWFLVHRHTSPMMQSA